MIGRSVVVGSIEETEPKSLLNAIKKKKTYRYLVKPLTILLHSHIFI